MSFGLAGKIAQQVNLKMCGKYFSLGRELWLSKMLSPRSLDRAKQSGVQTELSFKRPQCFHKTNSAPTQLSFKCQLRKFSSDLAIFLRTTSNDAGICTCLWLCELYVYFSCLFEVYLGLFGDGACIVYTVQCSWNVLNFRPWPKTFYSLCRCRRKRVPAVMLWFKSSRWLSIHTFIYHSVWVELEWQKRHNLHSVLRQSKCEFSRSVFGKSKCISGSLDLRKWYHCYFVFHEIYFCWGEIF